MSVKNEKKMEQRIMARKKKGKVIAKGNFNAEMRRRIKREGGGKEMKSEKEKNGRIKKQTRKKED